MSISKNAVISLMSCAMTISLLAGCGKDQELETYHSDMDTYFSTLADINYQMNSVDETSDTAQEEILACLDELDVLTAQMAELDVPKQFELVESLADEAADNMSSAVSLYHQLYSDEEYNESLAEGAYEYYERANMRIRYIRSILQGNIPEDLNIVEDEDAEYGE